MQTFLPYPDFAQSAKVLDRQRLGKQRVEAMQLLNALSPNYSGGWTNHPATRMWRGYESALALYGLTMCEEWKSRGYKDNLTQFFVERYDNKNCEMPPWIGDEEFHASHRSNLLSKNKDYYGQFGWTEPSWYPYVWPV